MQDSAAQHAAPTIPDHALVRRIGAGAYGEVWLARNTLGTLRAVKIVRRSAFGDDRPYEREFAGIQKFEPLSRSHEGFVDLLQVGRNDAEGWFYYVMELADPGERQKAEGRMQNGDAARSAVSNSPFSILLSSLAQYAPRTLAADVKTRGALPLDECLQIALTLTSALGGELHRHGLVHRDIKPSNIIFVEGVPKLADIGLVATANEARSYVGTEGFIPPEGPGTPQADLYSVGIVLYAISTGKSHRDFPEPPANLAASANHTRWLELQAVIHRACAPDLCERYRTAEQMRADLELLQRGHSVKRQHLWRRRIQIGKKFALAAAFIALFVVGSKLTRSKPPPQIAGSSTVETFETSGTTNREAYELYVKGREAMKSGYGDAHERAVAHLEPVVKLDPRFARGWSALALIYSRLDHMERTPPRVSRPKSREAALQALALDDSLAEPHVVLGKYKMYFEWDWLGAEQEFRRALELDSRGSGPRSALAGLFAHTNRREEGIQEMRRAIEMNPHELGLNTGLGLQLLYAGRLEEAEAQIRKVLAVDRNEAFACYQLGYVRWVRGDVDAAMSLWDRFHDLANGDAGADAEAHAAYRQAGGGAAGIAAYAKSCLDWDASFGQRFGPGSWLPPSSWVNDYMIAGDLDHAFEWYQRACDEHEPKAIFMAVNPFYSPLWRDPRFDDILRRMGLDKYFPERMHGSAAANDPR